MITEDAFTIGYDVPVVNSPVPFENTGMSTGNTADSYGLGDVSVVLM